MKSSQETTIREVAIPLHKPNAREMIFFFLCGVIMSVPITLFFSSLVDPLLGGLNQDAITLISVAVFPPLIEEFSKIFPLYYRHGETQRSISNLALMVGLGFGIVEFLLYVFLQGTFWPLRIPGLFFHPASASISAYGIATKRPIQFYALAVALHFTNNFLAVTDPFSPFSLSVFVVGVTVLISWTLHDKTKQKIIE